MEQMVYSKSLEQMEQREKARLAKATAGYKLSKGMDRGSHAVIPAISYAEYHTNKLNSQRPFDRPFGMADTTRWYNAKTKDWTYSEKTAAAWKRQGVEVFKYNGRGILEEVTNSTKATRRLFKGVRILYTYNR